MSQISLVGIPRQQSHSCEGLYQVKVEQVPPLSCAIVVVVRDSAKHLQSARGLFRERAVKKEKEENMGEETCGC